MNGFGIAHSVVKRDAPASFRVQRTSEDERLTHRLAPSPKGGEPGARAMDVHAAPHSFAARRSCHGISTL